MLQTHRQRFFVAPRRKTQPRDRTRYRTPGTTPRLQGGEAAELEGVRSKWLTPRSVMRTRTAVPPRESSTHGAARDEVGGRPALAVMVKGAESGSAAARVGVMMAVTGVCLRGQGQTADVGAIHAPKRFKGITKIPFGGGLSDGYYDQNEQSFVNRESTEEQGRKKK